MSKTYAHLVSGLAAKAAEKGEEEERMEDEKPPANDKEDGKKGKKAKKAAKDDLEEDAEAEEDDKKDDKKDSKKAVVADHAAIAEAARLEERLRCATIFGSDAAGGRLETACQFAFHTDLSAESAIAIMSTVGKAPAEAPAASASTKKSLDQRMAGVQDVTVGADVSEDDNQAGIFDEKKMAAMSPDQRALMIVNAGRAVRGEAALKSLN